MSRINTNIASLQAMSRLGKNQNELATRLQRLSSGLKINTGKDASGRADRQRNAAQRNQRHQPGDRQLDARHQRHQHAEGALNEVSSLLLEVQSLTNEAANNGALSQEEIKANQLQVDAIFRVDQPHRQHHAVQRCEAAQRRLDYTASGVASTAVDVATINAVKLPDNGYTTVTVEVTASALTGPGRFHRRDRRHQRRDDRGGRQRRGEQLSFAANTATSAVAFAVNQLKGATGVSALVNGGTLEFHSVGFGSDQFVSVKTINGAFTNGKGTGQDAGVNINGSRADVKGLVASVRSGDFDVNLTLDKNFAQNVSTTGTSFNVVGGGAKFQIGSQVNRQGQINVGITSVSTTKLGDEVQGFLSQRRQRRVNSLVSGNTIQAQKILSTAIRQVATLRGRLGALQKDVLNTNVNSLQTALENVTASESAIRDADFADETSKLTRAPDPRAGQYQRAGAGQQRPAGGAQLCSDGSE
jgi:flagellin